MTSAVSCPSRAYSLAGTLHMKPVGSAFNLLRIRRKLYFAIDEMNDVLIYFKDENDMINKKESLGEIPLKDAVFTLSENTENAFIVHSQIESVELQAENPRSCESWMHALARRNAAKELEKRASRAACRASMRRKSRDRSCSLPIVQSGQLGDAATMLRPPIDKADHPSSSSDLCLSVLEDRMEQLGCMQTWHGGRERKCSPRCLGPEGRNESSWVHEWIVKNDLEGAQSSSSTTDDADTSPYRAEDDQSTTGSSQELEELVQLRAISNQQKLKIRELNDEKRALTEQLVQMRQKAEENTPSGKDALVSQRKFLNSEVLRLNRKCIGMESKLTEMTSEIDNYREDLEHSRLEYVTLLQSSIKVPVHDSSGLDVMHVKLIGGDVHRERICQLTEEARVHEPSLPSLQSLMSGLHVDAYGFRHHFTDESLAIHYMATQLYDYYKNRLVSCVEHKRKWKHYLDENVAIPMTKESKLLCREGVPNTLRSTVWKLLVHQQVVEIKEAHGQYYFRDLCTQEGTADDKYCESHQKQIHLDLLRTMPNNVHFMVANSRGVTQLSQVLRAFCLHNPNLGYCQGMNFLAATALLFLTPEDAFWFLVAVTERYFDRSYFDTNLTGAQADQEVLKELLSNNYPAIAAHFEELDIDLTTITLNWFIALFFDAVPFNTMLRIWDTFLLEGPKVLFRFALVLLGHHQEEILLKSDTIGIMKVIKAAGRLSYDTDGIATMAFRDLFKIPSRAYLRERHSVHLLQLNLRFTNRNRIKEMLRATISQSSYESSEEFVSEIVLSPFDETAFVVAGSQKLGRIGRVQLDAERPILENMDIELDCRILSFVLVKEAMAFMSMISGYIVAVSIENDELTVLWELKLPDISPRLVHFNGRLFAALGNGSLTMFENIVERTPTCLEMTHLPLSLAPLTDLALFEEKLIVSTMCKYIIIDAVTLSTLQTLYVACPSANGSVPFFEKIQCLYPCSEGVFLSTARSTLIQLWKSDECSLLFDISFDHTQRKPSLSDDEMSMYISSLAFHDGTLWVGTSDGYIMIYKLTESLAPPESATKSSPKRFPAGRRLTPVDSNGQIDGKPMLCYVPTAEETKLMEENNNNMVPQSCRLPRRVSISIDRDSLRYSVSVARSQSQSTSDMTQSSGHSLGVRRTAHGRPGNPVLAQRPLNKGISADSAVSVFSSVTSVPSSCSSDLKDTSISPRSRNLLPEDPLLIAVPEYGQIEDVVDATSPNEKIKPIVGLQLFMKMKVSERAVRRIVPSPQKRCVLSCAGNYGDEESLLCWRKDREDNVWINDPVSLVVQLQVPSLPSSPKFNLS